MPSFLIAEDHSVLRMGISMIIKEMYADAAITEADTFYETLKLLQQKQFDLLLLDIQLPGGDSVEMIDAARKKQPDVRILIFSSYDEMLYGLNYIKAGANGYLSKTAPPAVTKEAIEKVLNGETYLSSPLQEKLINVILKPKHSPEQTSVSLSPREVEVMQLLAKGYSGKEIKAVLNIQDSTISTYKAKIMEKMNVSNVIELAEKLKAGGIS